MNVPQIAAGLPAPTLRDTICLLLLRLLDDGGLLHFEEGNTLVKAVNVLMLKILETRWELQRPGGSQQRGTMRWHLRGPPVLPGSCSTARHPCPLHKRCHRTCCCCYYTRVRQRS